MPDIPPWLTALAVGFAVAQVATLVTTVYLHRGLSHRALALQPVAAFPARVVTWVTTGIRPREWVAVHRKHHAFTDATGDPHSPRQLGWVRVQLTNAALYRRVARDGVTVRRYARDLPRDRWDRALFDHAFVGLAIGITALIVLLGPIWGVVAAAFHTVAYLGLNAAVNAVTHTFGSRPYDNSATNLQWLALLTAGEGLHNNHHAAPTVARLAHERGQVDLAWPVIRVLQRLRLATVRPVTAPTRETARAA
jgi:stearoyl-CoA desaturase (Delta-9 desaturase)